VNASLADLQGSEVKLTEAKLYFEATDKLYQKKPPAVSLETWARSREACEVSKADKTSKEQAVVVAKLELNQALTVLKLFEVRSPVAGVLKTIQKGRLAVVKQFEPVCRIQPRSDSRPPPMLPHFHLLCLQPRCGRLYCLPPDSRSPSTPEPFARS